MKSIILIIFILSGKILLAQVKVDVSNSRDATVIIGNGNTVTNTKNLSIYQTIQKITIASPDQYLLFIGFQLSDYRFDSIQSKLLRDKCSLLNELCLSSVKDDKFYQKNKSKISDHITEIFKLQQSSFKEAFITKVKKDYDSTRKENFLLSISALKATSDNDSAQTLLNYFDHTIYDAWNVDSTYFLSNLIRNNFNILIDAFSKRLEKTNSTIEIDKLFKLINSFIESDFNPKWDSYISLKVSESLKGQFSSTKSFLGQLLLEGYKDFLSNKGKLPKKPTSDDVKKVYRYIFPVSDESTLERNMLLSQITLLLQGDLICEQKTINKIESGYNWAVDEKRLNKIPFLMFNRNLAQLKTESQIGDTILTLDKGYYTMREKAIKSFNYKFDKFSKLQRIDKDVENSIFNDTLLKLGQLKYYDDCNLIDHVYYPNLYKYQK